MNKRIVWILAAAVLLIAARLSMAEEPDSSAGNVGGSASSAKKRENQRIILGSPAKPGAYPFQVLLNTRHKDGKGYICGGSLIGDATWVLTAGHCVTDLDSSVMAPYQISVFVGSVNYGEGNVILANQVYRHPTYNPRTFDYDMALIRLRTQPRAVQYGVITLVDTAQEATLSKSDTPVTIIGWGKMETEKTSSRLMEGHTRLKDRAQCNQNYVSYYVQSFERYLAAIPNSSRNAQFEELLFTTLQLDETAKKQVRDMIGKQVAAQQILDSTARAATVITERMICAGESAPKPGSTLVTDTCQGDSGGPLFTTGGDGKPIQLGVVSFGTGHCGSTYTAGVYARVAKFTNWINAVMSGMK